MGAAARLDGFQRRHAWAGFPIAVVYKFFDDQGSYLAALITYYGFLSLFPLLLLFVTILGFVLRGNAHLQQRILDSTLSEFPIIGAQIRDNVHSLHGSGPALAIGILGTLYGGLGVAQATQNALNRVWTVPRNERPNPIKSRLRSLGLLGLLGGGALATTALSALGASAGAYGASIGAGVRVAAIVLAVVVNVLLFLLAFRLLTARDVAIRDIAVGAVCAGILWQVLQGVGTYYVSHQLKGSSEAYGVFGLVLGLVAWIYLVAVVVVLCAEINVVRARRMWPRALLTPFTDNVDLTRADEHAYTSYAGTERFKGFEDVDVRFQDPPGRGS